MIRLAQLSIRRPKLALALSGSVRRDLRGHRSRRHRPSLADHDLRARAPSPRARRTLAEAEFGPSTLVPILLTGPRAQLDRAGPARWCRELTSRSDTRVLSAWDAGEAGAALAPVADRGDDPRVGRAHRGADDRPRPGRTSTGRSRSTSARPVRAHISGHSDARPGDRGRGAAHHARRHPAGAADPLPGAAAHPARAARRADHDRLRRSGRLRRLRRDDASVARPSRSTRSALRSRRVMGLALGTGPVPDDPHPLPQARKPPSPGRGHEATVAASAAVGSTGRAVLIAGTGLFAVAVPRVGHRTDATTCTRSARA